MTVKACVSYSGRGDVDVMMDESESTLQAPTTLEADAAES